MLTSLRLLLLAAVLILAGCGGGGGASGGSTGGATTPGAVGGGLQVGLDLTTLQPRAAALAVPSASQVRVEIVDSLGNPVVTPVVADVTGSSQTLTVTSIPVGTWLLKITVTDVNGNVLGYRQAPVTIQPGVVTSFSGAVVTSLQISPSLPDLAVGTSLPLTATALLSSGATEVFTNQVTWTVSPSSVASISPSGTLSGLAGGSGTATATYGPLTASVPVQVNAVTLVSLEVQPALLTLPEGVTQQYQAIGHFSDNSTQDLTSQVAWSTSDTGVATIDSSGLLGALAPGTADVIATSGAVSGTAGLTVNAAQLVSVEIQPTGLQSIPHGTTRQFQLFGTYDNGQVEDLTESADWTTSDSGIVDVSDAPGTKGLASAVAVGGPVTLTATHTPSGLAATAPVEGSPAVLTAIAVSPPTSTVAAGLTTPLSATGTFSDGSSGPVSDAVTWTSSDDSIATVDNSPGNEGVVTGLQAGTVTITATDPATGTVGTSTVDVTAARLVSLDVQPGTASVAEGVQQQYTAFGTYTDGSVLDLTGSVTWSSDNPSAFVSNAPGFQGLATGASPGDATIQALDPGTGITGTASLNVRPAEVVAVRITPRNGSVMTFDVLQMTATATMTNGQQVDVTTSVTWSSLNPDKATVDSGGLVQGVAVGTARIRAEDPLSGAADEVDVEVTFNPGA